MDMPTLKVLQYSMTLYLVSGVAISQASTCNTSVPCSCCKDDSSCNQDDARFCGGPCKEGYWGGRCIKKCPSECKSCNQNFRTTNECFECVEGRYGQNCSKTCPSCHICAKDTGACTICANGFYGTACQYNCSQNCLYSHCYKDSGECSDCISGHYGSNCSNVCSKTCKESKCEIIYGACIECVAGYYGAYCNKTCNKNCLGKMCSDINGICKACVIGTYGDYCNVTCPSTCNGSICDRNSGSCTHGCMENFIGDKCDECQIGKYGDRCNQNCPPNCYNKTCHRNNGICTHGCKGEYSDTRFCCLDNFNCENCSSQTKCVKCKAGFFGQKCEERCHANCERSCDALTGHCDNCINDHYGLFCENNCSKTCITQINRTSCLPDNGSCTYGCQASFYGDKCGRTCSEHCNVSCDQQSGECPSCQPDRFGIFCERKCSPACVRNSNGIVCDRNNGECFQGCLTGSYGDRCDNNCSVGCQELQCNGSTGECLLGCAEGFSGKLCIADTEQAADFPTAIVGIAAGVLIALVIVVVIVTVIRKRRSIQDKHNGERHPMTESSDKAEKTENAGVYANVPTTEPGGNENEDEDVYVPEVTQVNDEDENTYYNFINPNSKLRTNDLYRYLSKSDENYLQEFRMLPVGLIKPFNDAKLPQNTRRNRYNMVYPYDDSRVKVNDGNSDYINASYIDGYNKKNAYIACLGPTKDTLGDFSLFWKMIWQEKVETIVMVTKLKEASGMKCHQYWPNSGTTVRYGQVSVRSTGEEEYAEFVVRNMTLSMGSEERQFHHIHFTAWPDKGVPSDVISIINLRNKVTKMRKKFDGPLVVHCSAGIGRTGTYIALDILIHHGLAEQLVDVLGCIMNMRQQRVHMVQTVDQYKYLHHALLWSLSIDTEPVPADRFNDLSWVYKDDGLAKMLKQLQMENWYDTTEEKSAVEANKKRSFANRKNADIPGSRHAVKMLPRDEKKPVKTEYINAVFIDGYKRQNRFIAAQTPLPETVPTFLDMVVQRHVICIIDLEPHSSLNDVGEYLSGDNGELQNGNVVVRSSDKKDVGSYVKRKLEIIEDKQIQGSIIHYQFTKWPRSEVVPDSEQFIQLIHDVETLIIQSDQSGPILVHCLDGAKRSALFCAMWLLIERIGADQSVSVLNTLRQVKSRRRNAFPNKEQIEFCFNGVVTHLNQLNLNVYSNT